MRSTLVRFLVSAAVVAVLPACTGSREAPLTADLPLHLEDHLDAAVIEGAEPPDPVPATVEWRFDQPQPEWKAARPVVGGYRAADLVRTDDALRVVLPEGRRNPRGQIVGGLYIDLPDWRREEWAEVLIRARTADPVANLVLALNPREGAVPASMDPLPQVFERSGGTTPVVSDGSVQTYRIRPDWSDAGPGPWRRLGLGFQARGPGSIDILSVSVVRAAALYASERAGLRSINVAGTYRRALFTHAPGRIAYRVRVPEGGRLDTALGILGAHEPVDFRVLVRAGSGEETTLLAETQADPDRWAGRSVDLARFAGQTITLALETRAATAAAVAFWGAPTVSGARRTEQPNVIFYVIDGGWADDMSVYGYQRRTTPNLERLAAEGAVFEHAYSNSGWTKPSTASFMTSLHNSVLGNTSSEPVDPVSPQAITMAERFHQAGYATSVFTSNPNAGTVSGLQRGADLLMEPGFQGGMADAQNDMTSSVTLHEQYWRWRENAPEPYWVHFQPTDVHAYEGGQPTPVVPFSGLFVETRRRREFFDDWARFDKQRGSTGGATNDFYRGQLEAAGIDRGAFFETMRGLYDESLAHQDYQIGRLVERLRERGEWERTLLVVGGDHAIAAALWDLAALMQVALPPRWNSALLRPSITRVPLLVVWPGHIQGGQRFDPAVSMIDVLPTVLDLAGLPQPEILQGQSLAPLLRRQPGWTPRPVILDEFDRDDETGRLVGRIEAIDGRWGASLRIGGPPPEDPARRRLWPLLLYDLWADPWALRPVNEQRPDLVEKYTAFLEDQFQVHQTLAKQFTPGAKPALTPEQLERLRALGYIR